MRAVFSLIHQARVIQCMALLDPLPNPLTARNASNIPPVLERGTRLSVLALFLQFYLFFTWPGAGAFPSLRFLSSSKMACVF